MMTSQFPNRFVTRVERLTWRKWRGFVRLRAKAQLGQHRLKATLAYFQENVRSFMDHSVFKERGVVIQTFPRSGTEYTCNLLIKIRCFFPLRYSYPHAFEELEQYENHYGGSLFWSSSSWRETVGFVRSHDGVRMMKPDIYMYHYGAYLSVLGPYKVIKKHHFHPISENIRTVFVLRYPFDTIKSLFLSHRRGNQQLVLTDERLRTYLTEWKNAIQLFETECSEKPNRTIILFEDFLRDFDKTLGRLVPDLTAEERGWAKALMLNEDICKQHIFWGGGRTFFTREQWDLIREELRDLLILYWPERSPYDY